jgi:hypothetical protein
MDTACFLCGSNYIFKLEEICASNGRREASAKYIIHPCRIFSHLIYSYILKMEAAAFSEKLVTIYQIHGVINQMTVIFKYFVC